MVKRKHVSLKSVDGFTDKGKKAKLRKEATLKKQKLKQAIETKKRKRTKKDIFEDIKHEIEGMAVEPEAKNNGKLLRNQQLTSLFNAEVDPFELVAQSLKKS